MEVAARYSREVVLTDGTIIPVGAYVNPLAGDRSVAPGGSPGATAVNIVQGNANNAAASAADPPRPPALSP